MLHLNFQMSPIFLLVFLSLGHVYGGVIEERVSFVRKFNKLFAEMVNLEYLVLKFQFLNSTTHLINFITSGDQLNSGLKWLVSSILKLFLVIQILGTTGRRLWQPNAVYKATREVSF